MTHPRYNDWPDDIKDYYEKIRNKINKHGHVIQGTVDGKDLYLLLGKNKEVQPQ